jgi:hypothetical protein
MTQLRAPAAKIVPFLEELFERGTDLAAIGERDPRELPAAAEAIAGWRSLVFQALQRAFVDFQAFTRPWNAAGITGYPDQVDSPAVKHRREMLAKLAVLTEAIIAAKAARSAPGKASSKPAPPPDARA